MKTKKMAWTVLGLVVCLALMAGLLAVVPALAANTVGMVIDPTPKVVNVGDTFSVNIKVTITGGQPVDFAEAHINFAPAKLEVVSITPGATMGNVMQNTFNNVAGTLDYGAGPSFGSPRPTTDFVLATVQLHAKEQTGGTALQFRFDAPQRETNAFYQGQPVLNALLVFDGNVIINVIQYTLTVTADPAQGGTVTGGGTFPAGTDAPITATPADACWYFVNWSGGVNDPDSPITFIHMDGNKSAVAHFAKFHYTLTTAADPPQGGTVTPGGVYDCCTTVPITATPTDACWRFVNWTGPVTDPNSPTTSVHIDSAKSVTAHFAKYQYVLTVNASPSAGGNVTGAGTFDCCTNAPVTATPNNCYRFGNWTGAVANPSLATTTVHIDGNKTVTANFVPVTALLGTVQLQGRPVPPHPSWITPLTVALFKPGTSTLIGNPYYADTNTSGQFTVANIDSVACDIGIKCPRSLSRLATGVQLFGCNFPVGFNTLLEGDANNDDHIGGADYSLLYTYYGQSTPEALAKCDFNRDGYVGGADYSLLYTNYGKSGEMPKWPVP